MFNLKIFTFGFLWVLGFVIWNLLTPSPALATNSGIFSMELWVKPTSSIASQALVGKSEELRMFTDSSGFVGCQIKTTTWQTAVTSSTAITLNRWTHVACTYDKINLKISVNGVQTGSQALTTLPDDTSAVFKIGQDDSASTPYSNLTGVVDGFEFYNYALTSKQIVSDMNAGHPAVGSPLGSAVGYWKFDEGADNKCSGGTNDVCNSGSGGSALDGAESGMAVPATSTSGWTNSGKFGKALSFDGSNDFIVVSDNAALNPTTAITASTWINISSYPASDKTILAKGNWAAAATAAYELYLGSSGSILKFRFVNSSSSVNCDSGGVTVNPAIPLNTWTHIIATYDGTNCKLFINGINKYTVNTGIQTLKDEANNLNIGRRPDAVQYFAGSIDEVKIYDYALTSDEVKTEYNRGSSLVLGAAGNNSSYQPQAANQEYCIPGDTTSCAAPVGRWDLEEGTGTAVNDTSGNGKTGTWAGTGSHWTTGKMGKGGNFNGSDDLVDTSNNPYSNSQISSGAIEAWVKTTSNLAATKLIADIEGYANINISSTGKAMGCSDGVCTFATSTTSVNDGNWHHLVVVWSGTSYTRIFVDGKQEDSKTPTAAPAPDNTNRPFRIGAHSAGGAPFTGQIDSVKVFGYARSAAQIAWDYNRGKPVGWWKMDECQGTVANDSSGNSNTGTITATSTLGTCTTSSTFWGGSGGTGAGKRNYAPTFNGTGDYISVSNNSSLNPTNFTISTWIKPTTVSTDYIVSKQDYASNQTYGYSFYINSSSKLQLRLGNQLNQWRDAADTGASIGTGSWIYVSVSWDGTNASFYQNGILTSTIAPNNSGAMVNSSNTLNIGRWWTTFDGGINYFNGQIDDVKIFNYALTATQVKDIYNSGAVNFGPLTGSP
ncbi:MAG: hypothetical protein UU73_C0007G0018 [Candidatus Daviesbacteria bacterium GW2011_GWA1_41_61]|uniref:LamG-like jellyroll fold domain-containing protein n=1 Tax=Candidatus Daviesbacteria bacterium GW2011_GWA2_40_9 TaxID=1618424 RepID=A0A0G0TZV9_9BACT|nr:MAG: hypothetical protein UU29_C0014G0011 [Candidatus Daviesbacteria bacterium GW2011_GWA2_40_9]KKR92752.1 MAG: hypothetical protein UU44_C0005G0082 [Candidatus Daviesbacteria bacterium GW2011_GWB1_41_15]KKS14511.1 MAG: hypothetical protein UU73_C0007G0018 [Candidatus Daviesbacteria bacterium GW2011_GWA1_41_61]